MPCNLNVGTFPFDARSVVESRSSISKVFEAFNHTLISYVLGLKLCSPTLNNLVEPSVFFFLLSLQLDFPKISLYLNLALL